MGGFANFTALEKMLPDFSPESLFQLVFSPRVCLHFLSGPFTIADKAVPDILAEAIGRRCSLCTRISVRFLVDSDSFMCPNEVDISSCGLCGEVVFLFHQGVC